MARFSFRFGLRSKLFLFTSFLFTIPWFGYQYVWEMEKYLRYGQEQTIVGTARALATALHERPNLFNNQASFLPSVEKGKDLYGFALKQAIQLDGLFIDWPNYDQRSHYYGQQHQIPLTTLEPLSIEQLSLNFTTALGKYDKYLYLFFKVVDNTLIYRSDNSRSITRNDHLELAFIQPNEHFIRFIVSNKQAGWLDAYRITDIEDDIPQPAPYIQGQWLETPQGYNIELRIPLSKVGDKIAFALHDVDETGGEIVSSIGSADPRTAETLGTILVPSPEIERIVKGMHYTHSSIWVVDQHHRVLASAGDINKASGVWHSNPLKNSSKDNNSWWQHIEQQWLLPLYYKILTRPADNFIDQLYDASNLTGDHIISALNGQAKSQWRLTQDNQAVILSAATPIYINNKVHGAVIVEENTNGIRTLRNRALEKLFSAILAIMFIGALSFFLFASRITYRIRTLRDQAERAIDDHGRITQKLIPSNTNDEIGDLSRSFSTAVNRLSQYNHYLENMSSRLSHELRTPIAVVRTSLEILSMQSEEHSHELSKTTIDRAQSGISRLNLILTNMSEATRIEQMLHSTEKQNFELTDVINGCMQGY
ncbi:MAG: proteobacterial dedicated sortase system histidine kinase, partial [Colwellia sp.]|nr:proteobacterial dedicated sortase system histidine kinase [Colwellia sp.]